MGPLESGTTNIEMHRLVIGFRGRHLIFLLGCFLLASAAFQYARADELCAVVKIEIRQELTLERQAFDAHMRITNGLDTLALENADIAVWFQDEDGQPVLASSNPDNTDALFFIRLDEMTGIGDVSGNGTIAPGGVADIHWLIIPAFGAGGNSSAGALYFVGATLSYTLGGEPETVEVAPDFITVRPMPLLELDYFLPEEVIGNDPSTDDTEPAEPFELGVRITNSGYGAAINLAIESAQPEIVSNDQGLLIDFEILDTQVNDHPVTNSLLASFGDLPAGHSSVAVWQMISSLYGNFVSFEADYYHSDELGGELTSLIDRVDTHTLIRSVRNDLPGRDAVRDFLARDGDTLRLYESQGMNTDVTDVSSGAVLTFADSSGSTQYYNLSFPQTVGPLYVVLPDPTHGEGDISSVWRSDGKHILAANVWQSRSKASGNWENLFHLFDTNSTGEYEVRFQSDTHPNRPPALGPVNDQEIAAGSTLHMTFFAADPDDDPLAFALDPLPDGASFSNEGNGIAIFVWSTQESDAGLHEFVISVSDGELEDTGTFFVQVTETQVPAIMIDAELPLITSEDGDPAFFDISLGAEPEADVWIPLNSSNEDEGVVAVSGVWFTAQDWDIPQTVRVDGVDDDIFDGDVGYEILVGPAESGDMNYHGLEHPPLPALNLENDEPKVIVSPLTGLTTAGPGTRAWMQVQLNGPPAAPVTISFDSDIWANAGQEPVIVTLDAETWDQPFEIEIVGGLIDPAPVQTREFPYEIYATGVQSDDENFDNLDVPSVEVIHREGVTWGMEAGRVELPPVDDSSEWVAVEFAQSFETAPIVVFLPDDGEPDPASVRVRNITTEGFELVQVEPPSSFSGADSMTVHYLAVEPGSSKLPGGGFIEVYFATTDAVQDGKSLGEWEQVDFHAPFGSPPVLLTAIQSNANEQADPPVEPSTPWLTVAVEQVNQQGFQVALERSEVFNGPILEPETIGYVAITPGDLTFPTNVGWAYWLGEEFPALAIPWDDGCEPYDWFVNNPEPDAILLAGQITRNSVGGGWLRLCTDSNSEFGLLMDQDVERTDIRGQFDEEVRALQLNRPFHTRFLWESYPTITPLSLEEDD